MKLIVNELKTELVQVITVGDHPIQLYAIRPHLYRHLWASGAVYIEIRDLNGQIIDTSEVIDIADLPTGNYFHGLIRFRIATELQAGASYQIAIVSVAPYSFNESAYIGWCVEWDTPRIPASYTLVGAAHAPFDFELWEMRNVLRRAS